MIFLSSCDNNGSNKMPLIAIGNSKILRAFKKNTGQELGLDYHVRKNGMDQNFTTSWLAGISRSVHRPKPGRKTLLLLDNCSVDGRKEAVAGNEEFLRRVFVAKHEKQDLVT